MTSYTIYIYIYPRNPSYLGYGLFLAVSFTIPMAPSTKLPHLVAGSWASPRSWHDACAAVASGNPLSAWGEGSGDSAGWWRSPGSCEESWKLTCPLLKKNMVFWCVLILVRGFVHAVTYAFIIYIYIISIKIIYNYRIFNELAGWQKEEEGRRKELHLLLKSRCPQPFRQRNSAQTNELQFPQIYVSNKKQIPKTQRICQQKWPMSK